jgi:MraZ protein
LLIPVEWEKVGFCVIKWGKKVFYGRKALTLDAKGRISIPTQHRAALAEQGGGRLALTQHLNGRALLVYPWPEWEKKRVEIAALPYEADGWKNMLLGSAEPVEMDGAGRVLITPELREIARMTRDVVLMGMGLHFQLWDATELARSEAAVRAQEPPEAVKKFVL